MQYNVMGRVVSWGGPCDGMGNVTGRAICLGGQFCWTSKCYGGS